MTKPNVSPEITPEQIEAYGERESERLRDGTYTRLPAAWRASYWFKYGISDANLMELQARYYDDDPQVLSLPRDPCHAYANHFAHVSMRDGAMVAFTESHIKGVADRQTVMKAGKYLKKFYGHCLDDNTIRDMATEFSAEYAPMTMQFATTADDIERVYTNGPSSCMSYNAFSYQGSCHPVRAYASPDLAVAYIARADREEGATARCVVWPERKVHTRIYGDSTRLKPLLKEAGYVEGSLEGARLVAIRDEESDGFVVPYVDYCHSAHDSNDGFLVIGRGDIHLNSTNGLSESCISRCAHCDDRVHEDTAYSCEGVDGDLCEDCYGEITVICERTDTTILRDDAVEMHDGAYWSNWAFARHGFMCPIMGERFAQDDGVEMPDGELWSQEAFDGSGFTSHADGRNYDRAVLVVMADGALWHQDHFAEHGHIAADGSSVRNADAPIDAVKYRCEDTLEMDFPATTPVGDWDWVVCIHPVGVSGQFTPGSEYQVSQRFMEHGRERISVVADDAGNPNGWCSEHFRPSNAFAISEAA